VAAPIAHRAVAEVPPAAPQQRVQFVVVIAERHRADPLFPVQAGRHRLGGQTPADAPAARTGPAVRLQHVAHGARPDVLDQPADALAAVPLLAQLRDHVVLLGRGHHQTHFLDRVRQGLFHVHVLAQRHGDHRRQEVVMVRSGDEDGVDALVHLVEHLAIVVEDLQLRRIHVGSVLLEPVVRRGQVVFVDVHQGHQVLGHGSAEAGQALVRTANHDRVEFRIRRALAEYVGRGEHLGSQAQAGGGRRASQKRATSKPLRHDASPFVREGNRGVRVLLILPTSRQDAVGRASVSRA